MSTEIISALLQSQAVTLRRHPPFVWTSGLQSPIYTDNRILISYPQYREKVIEAFLELIQKNNLSFDGIAATATAGIAWGAWLAQVMNKPLVYVRGSAKKHGKEKLIEGKLEEGETYLIVEDLLSTGKSVAHAIDSVKEAGGKVTDVLAIFTYEFHSTEKHMNEREVTSHTLATFSQLIEVAVSEKYISEEDKQSLLEWKKQPEQWQPN